ncbi:reverse transcriptase domain-containing protein [Tanacetum coccineum]
MTDVPRSITEHKLRIRQEYSPVRQKKHGQALERAKAILEERLNLLKWEVRPVLERFLSSQQGQSSLFKTLKKCRRRGDFPLDYRSRSAFMQLKQHIAALSHASSTPDLGEELSPKPDAVGAMQKWGAWLLETDAVLPQSEVQLQEPWILFTDGSSCVDGSGAGLILTNPEGMEFTYALRFEFSATNNEAEYEALIAGLRIAARMGVSLT